MTSPLPTSPPDRPRGRRRWGLMIALLLTATLTACGSGASATNSATTGPIDPGATLRLAWSSVPTQLDPHRSTVEPVDFRVLNLVYDRLLTIEPDGSIGPMLATSWEYAEDGLSLTLTLREGVTFRDGTPLDAAAVAANLERARTIGGVVSQRLSNVDGVEAIAPNQVRINLKSPTTELPSVLSQNAGLIMNPKLLTDGDPGATTDGTGPYVVESFSPGASVVLNRAPDADRHWDPDTAKLARIEHTRIVDAKALTNALRSKQVDAAQLAAPEHLADIQGEIDRGDLDVIYVEQQSALTLYFNRDIAPLDNVEVRRAINQALDRQALVDAFYPGSEPAVQLWRRNDPHFDAQLGDPYPYDPAAARQRLAEAGFPDGVDIGTVMISNSLPSSIGEAAQAMLAEVGIRAELQVTDSAQIYGEYARGAAPAMLNYMSGYGSAASTIERLVGQALNPAGRTSEADALLTGANDSRKSEQEQREGFRALTNHLADEAWYAPLVWINWPWPHNPRIAGFSKEEMDYISTLGAYDWRRIGMRSPS